MSNQALSLLVQQQVGIEAILHYTCRDRNVLGIQSDLLGQRRPEFVISFASLAIRQRWAIIQTPRRYSMSTLLDWSTSFTT